jgi:cytochrome c-type biogenesis protein CcmH/NrfG
LAEYSDKENEPGEETERNAITTVSEDETSRLPKSDPILAEQRARSVLAGDPGNIGARVQLGAALRRQNRDIEAVAVLEPIACAHGEMPAVLFALRGNRLDDANRVLDELIRTDGSNARAIKLRADSELRLGRHAEAEALLRHCLEIAPDMEPARFRYATLLLATKRPRESLQQIIPPCFTP